MKFKFAFLAFLILVVVTFGVWWFSKSNQPERSSLPSVLGPQTNSEGEVTVLVAPINISTFSSSWDFRVTMDTHSVELDDYLLASAKLIVDGRDILTPFAWEGPAEGGHHRSGILKFNSLNPFPNTIEILLQGVGDGSERVFTWEL